METERKEQYRQGIFRTLKTHLIEKMSELGTPMTFKKGKVIFEEGEYLAGVFFVESGVCKLSKLSSNGRNQIVRFVKEGSALGQRSVVSQEPVNLTATVIKDMSVCFIPKEYILDSFIDNPKFSMELIKDLCNELRKADNFIADMSQKTVRQRLADALIYLNDTFGLDKDNYIDMPLSREELGNFVGTATESLIRSMSSLTKEKIIRTQGRTIRILKYDELKRIAIGE